MSSRLCLVTGALVRKPPVMVTPRWVSQPAQPLAVEDLITYLVSAADVELSESVVVEIGGADLFSPYNDMQRAGFRRACREMRPRRLGPLAPGEALRL